jgi:uncharacterized protein
VNSKEVVTSLYQAYTSKDPQRITSLLHEDVVWIAPAGNATQVALGMGNAADAGVPNGSNDLDRNTIVQFMAYNFPRLFRDVKIEPKSLVAEGNTVLMEHRLSAILANGRTYVNDYCFAFEVRDGKVAVIREYMDTRGGWVQIFGSEAPAKLLDFIAA